MKQSLTIGDYSNDGLLQIVGTTYGTYDPVRNVITCGSPDDSPLLVTVRELIGGGDKSWVGGMPIERMRRLARRTMLDPIESARTVRRFDADGCGHVTFAVKAS